MRVKFTLGVLLCLTFFVGMASGLQSPDVRPLNPDASGLAPETPPLAGSPFVPDPDEPLNNPGLPDTPDVGFAIDPDLFDPSVEVCAEQLCTGLGEEEAQMRREGKAIHTSGPLRTLQQSQEWISSVPQGVWWMMVVVAVTGTVGKVLAVGPGRFTYGISRVARWCIAAPLFSRIIPAQILENENRAKVLGFLDENPGLSIQEIRERLDVAWGTAVYHLDRLRKEGKVVSHKSGNHHRYWVSGTPEARVRHGWAALEQPTARSIAETVARAPGIHQAAICQHLDVRAPNASKQLARLEKHGLVEKHRISRFNVYQPTDTLHRILEMQGTEVEGDPASA